MKPTARPSTTKAYDRALTERATRLLNQQDEPHYKVQSQIVLQLLLEEVFRLGEKQASEPSNTVSPPSDAIKAALYYIGIAEEEADKHSHRVSIGAAMREARRCVNNAAEDMRLLWKENEALHAKKIELGTRTISLRACQMNNQEIHAENRVLSDQVQELRGSIGLAISYLSKITDEHYGYEETHPVERKIDGVRTHLEGTLIGLDVDPNTGALKASVDETEKGKHGQP